jgi:hypothetical protein
LELEAPNREPAVWSASGNHDKADGRVRPGEVDAHQDGGDRDQDCLRSEGRRERRAKDGGSDHEAPCCFANAGGNQQSSRCQTEEDRKELCGEDVLEQQQAGIRATRMIGTSPPGLRVVAWAVAASPEGCTSHMSKSLTSPAFAQRVLELGEDLLARSAAAAAERPLYLRLFVERRGWPDGSS